MRRLSPRIPSPSMLVALLALFVALGGSAYAVKAAKAPKNSVVTKSIKKGAVTRAKIANGAVGSNQLGDGAVTASKVAAKALGAAQIDVASLNIPGPTAYTLRTTSETVTLSNGSSEQVISECLPGEQIVGGGARNSYARVAAGESIPAESKNKPDYWLASFTNLSGETLNNIQIQATAICAKG